jgi:hypothetical protein
LTASAGCLSLVLLTLHVRIHSFFYVKEKLVSALSKLHAAFKGSHPQLAKALSQAKNEIEDTGLFEDM